MTHGSLFSGLGGFDLAAEWAGWENKFNCEWNPFCQKVLNYWFKEAISYGDITKSDFAIWRGKIDILSGGFPCQPYSVAGERKGTEDIRHLWPQMLRAVREIKPRWIVGENVPGIVNWNKGLVFENVQAELEAEGYTVWPVLLPAAGVNAPHKRERVWFIAYSNSNNERCIPRPQSRCPQKTYPISGNTGSAEAITNTKRVGQQRQGWAQGSSNSEENGDWKASWTDDDGGWPIQSPICGGDDGFPGRLDNITFSNWRIEGITGFGNAIIPQIAYKLFSVINEMEARI